MCKVPCVCIIFVLIPQVQVEPLLAPYLISIGCYAEHGCRIISCSKHANAAGVTQDSNYCSSGTVSTPQLLLQPTWC